MEKLNRCYDCGEIITKKNESKEHIIHNSIGGRLKSTKLLCSVCNPKYSPTIDLEIEKQLGPFVSALGIKRERKKKVIDFVVVDAAGNEKHMGQHLIPLEKMIIDTDGEPKTYHVQPGQYEAKKAELEAALKNAKYEYRYEEHLEHHNEAVFIKNEKSTKPGEVGFGGIPYLRGVAKMALNYYLHRGYNKSHATKIIDFVKVGTGDVPVYFYAPSNFEAHTVEQDEVSHIIHIRGSKQYKMLYAYVELFNLQSVLIPFDMEYDGDEINDTYAYDLLNNQVMDKKVLLKLTRQHLQDIDLLEIRSDIFDARLHRLTSIIQKRHQAAIQEKKRSSA